MTTGDAQIVRARIEQAARLLTSCVDLVGEWTPLGFGEEIERRNLELVAHGLLSWAVDLVNVLKAARITLEPMRCPHCAWIIPPRSVARCPRCNLPREVRDESRDHPRRAS
jgi:hypothetical protein